MDGDDDDDGYETGSAAEPHYRRGHSWQCFRGTWSTVFKGDEHLPIHSSGWMARLSGTSSTAEHRSPMLQAGNVSGQPHIN